MVDECKPNMTEFEWAVCKFNDNGGDNSYFLDLYDVQNALKTGSPGEALVDFLNHWSMRVGKDLTSKAINNWYIVKGAEQLEFFAKNTLTNTNLHNGKVIESIIELYCGLYRLKGIKDTGASKILHLLIPNFFVMWDNPIREHYIGECKGPGGYILFLKKMQDIARALHNQNINSQTLSLNIKNSLDKQVKKQLKKITNEDKKQDIMKYVKENGKTITKFIDEFNWVIYTKKWTMPTV